ncbi:MAG: hypothetical protein ACYC3X_14415 [Pirellulaceae bacterium]
MQFSVFVVAVLALCRDRGDARVQRVQITLCTQFILLTTNEPILDVVESLFVVAQSAHIIRTQIATGPVGNQSIDQAFVVVDHVREDAHVLETEGGFFPTTQLRHLCVTLLVKIVAADARIRIVAVDAFLVVGLFELELAPNVLRRLIDLLVARLAAIFQVGGH